MKRSTVPGLIVAAYGPFGRFKTNPALELANEIVQAVEVLPVSYHSVDQWLEGLAAREWSRLLVLGVHGSTRDVRLETQGRNFVGETPDIEGVVKGPGLIEGDGPSACRATLWRDKRFRAIEKRWIFGRNAGPYLCNYVLYRSLRLFPGKDIGFVHVASFDHVPKAEQLVALAQLFDLVEALK